MSKGKFRVGQRVILLEFDTGTEVIPEEKGYVLHVESDGPEIDDVMYTVEVDVEFRKEPGDDGLRELGEEQLRAIDDSEAVPDQEVVPLKVILLDDGRKIGLGGIEDGFVVWLHNPANPIPDTKFCISTLALRALLTLFVEHVESELLQGEAMAAIASEGEGVLN